MGTRASLKKRRTQKMDQARIDGVRAQLSGLKGGVAFHPEPKWQTDESHFYTKELEWNQIAFDSPSDGDVPLEPTLLRWGWYEKEKDPL